MTVSLTKKEAVQNTACTASFFILRLQDPLFTCRILFFQRSTLSVVESVKRILVDLDQLIHTIVLQLLDELFLRGIDLA